MSISKNPSELKQAQYLLVVKSKGGDLAEYFMEGILPEIKSVLKTQLEGETSLGIEAFPVIRTWKLGVVPPNAVFPVITILPVNERPYSYSTGGLYHSERVFDIEIYTSGFPVTEVERVNLNLAHIVEKAIRSNINWTWGSRTFDTLFNAPISQVSPVADGERNRFIVCSSIRIFTKCKNYRADDHKITGTDGVIFDPYTNNNVSYNILLRLIALFSQFRTTYSTSLLGLSEVRVLEKGNLPINATFPAIVISEPQNVIDRTHAGMDTENRSVIISIFTRAFPQEEHLFANLRLATKIQRLIHLYPKISLEDNGWVMPHILDMQDGREKEYKTEKIIDTSIENVQYNITPDFIYYQTDISLLVKTKRVSILTS